VLDQDAYDAIALNLSYLALYQGAKLERAWAPHLPSTRVIIQRA